MENTTEHIGSWFVLHSLIFIFIENSMALMYINIFLSTYKRASVFQIIANYLICTEAGRFNFLLQSNSAAKLFEEIFLILFYLDIYSWSHSEMYLIQYLCVK